jgi:molybdopterin synthase sulfur carrier subunit
VGQGDPWKSGFESVKRIRFSVNQAMADETAAIKDGDEVAFFPPVTGG